MAERSHQHQLQVHPVQHPYDVGKPQYSSDRGPSASQMLAVLAGLPVGGMLLALAGLALGGTVIGLLVATPLFIIFSPVLVPAAIVIGLAVAAFLTSGAFGLSGLASLSYVLDCVRRATGTESLDQARDQTKRRVQDMADYMGQKTKDLGQKTKDLGQSIQNKGHEVASTDFETRKLA